MKFRRKKRCTVNSFGKIGKWSDGEQWVIDREGVREVSEEVINRSRV